MSAFCKLLLVFLIPVTGILSSCKSGNEIKIAFFRADATPPIGSPVAYAPARTIVDSLTARGIVLTGVGDPVVIVTVDWITIANDGLTVFKSRLAEAAHTSPDRVAIHVLHQHDTPRCDFSTEALMEKSGLGGKRHDNQYLNRVMNETADALSDAIPKLKPVTHITFGQAKVEKVASNRRILGDDGKVAIVRFSKATDPRSIDAPEGLIDPWLKSVSFWSDEKPLVTLSYYATHPQSYYGKGDVNTEFIGMARKAREKKTGVPQVFFIGAAGNVAAGKYNDGSEPMRAVLASRIESAMRDASANTQKLPVDGLNEWKTISIQLPAAGHMKADSLQLVLHDRLNSTEEDRFSAARKLAWLDEQKKGKGIEVSALHLGDICLLHLPSELFVEYQLYAQKLKPDAEVCTAGYGEGGQGYIGTRTAYLQGGYEVQPRVSMVAPDSEEVLMKAIEDVLK